MKFILGLLLVLMIATMAQAKPETNTIGPYKVSFDLNTTINHTIELAQPVDSPYAVLYDLFITTRNYTLAQLSIIESKNLTDSTLSTDKYINEQNLIIKGYFKNISFADMQIDGKKGFALTGLNANKMRLFQASYWLDRKDCECGPVSIGTNPSGCDLCLSCECNHRHAKDFAHRKDQTSREAEGSHFWPSKNKLIKSAYHFFASNYPK